MIDVVVCAHNEAATIGPVIEAIRRAPSAGRVHVMADRCTDATEAVAWDEGATPWPGVYGDKGTAMWAGLTKVSTELVAFLDADLSGLTPAHVEALLRLPPLGGQVVGIRDNGVPFAGYLPPVSGDRRLPADVARAAQLNRAGWAAETRLNVAVERAGLPWKHYLMHGVTNPTRPSLTKYAAIVAQYVLWAPELARYLAHPAGTLHTPAPVV